MTKSTCAKYAILFKGPSPPLSTSVDIDVTHVINGPRSSPALFQHTASNQNMDGGKAWERGYPKSKQQISQNNKCVLFLSFYVRTIKVIVKH